MLVFIFVLVLLDGCLGNKLLEKQIVTLFFGGTLGLVSQTMVRYITSRIRGEGNYTP